MDARGVNLLATLGTALGDEVTAAAAEASGLAGAAAGGLAELLAEPGSGMDAFARTTGLTGSGGVRLVDRLAAAGLVERRAGRDGRAVSLWLTPAGEQAARKVLHAREVVISRLLAGLDGDEQATLVRLAEKVLTAITRDRDHADWLCRLCDLDACPQARCPVGLAVQ